MMAEIVTKDGIVQIGIKQEPDGRPVDLVLRSGMISEPASLFALCIIR